MADVVKITGSGANALQRKINIRRFWSEPGEKLLQVKGQTKDEFTTEPIRLAAVCMR
jgi:hypothetical protein